MTIEINADRMACLAILRGRGCTTIDEASGAQVALENSPSWIGYRIFHQGVAVGYESGQTWIARRSERLKGAINAWLGVLDGHGRANYGYPGQTEKEAIRQAKDRLSDAISAEWPDEAV